MGLLVLIALLTRQAGPEAAAAAGPVTRPGRVIVVALCGKLSPEEIAGPGYAAGGLGRPVPEGVLVERIAFTIPDAGSRIDGLRDSIFPPGVTPATVRLEDGDQPSSAPQAPALQRLQARFGAPPAPRSDETEAVARLRKAAGAPATRPRAIDAPLDAIRSARICLVLVEAAGTSADDVRRRSEVIRRIVETADASAHVLIACLPEEGRGGLLARGPLFRSGQVIAGEKPATIIRAAVSFILDRRSDAKDAGEAACLFRERLTE